MISTTRFVDSDATYVQTDEEIAKGLTMEVNDGFANLRTLENRLSSLKSNLSSYNTQLDKQRRRKENIESIIKEMKRICSNRTDDVNTHLNKMINNYEDAAKSAASTSTLLSTQPLIRKRYFRR